MTAFARCFHPTSLNSMYASVLQVCGVFALLLVKGQLIFSPNFKRTHSQFSTDISFDASRQLPYRIHERDE
jgi:hypothetical protein